MKNFNRILFTTVAALALCAAPAIAKDKHSADDAAQQRKEKMKLPFELPSRNQPEPKTCDGRCTRDKGDCDAMCKSVQGQGAGPCKKACGDVQKQCLDDCKSEG